jgi:hypothetical protein
LKNIVSVIIPTTAELRRRDSLLRAIDSAISQHGAVAKLVVVVNGSRCYPSLLQELEELPLQIVRLREASLPSAIHAGRLSVASQYFSFLDDDDIYLPDALECRLDALNSKGADFAVSNGINAAGGLVIPDIRAAESNPLRALMTTNWLASCGGLYRSESISAEFFLELVKYVEWTVLGFRLLMAGKKVCFVDDLTFRLSDTEGSASKQRSMESVLNGAAVVEYMFTHAPAEVRAGLAWKRAATYHEISDYCLHSGHLSQAWRMHVSSIRMGGWQYLAYTRHLIWQPCKAWFVG